MSSTTSGTPTIVKITTIYYILLITYHMLLVYVLVLCLVISSCSAVHSSVPVDISLSYNGVSELVAEGIVSITFVVSLVGRSSHAIKLCVDVWKIGARNQLVEYMAPDLDLSVDGSVSVSVPVAVRVEIDKTHVILSRVSNGYGYSTIDRYVTISSSDGSVIVETLQEYCDRLGPNVEFD